MDPLYLKAQTDLQERLSILPEELVALITDGTLEATVLSVQKKYSLTEEQATQLENEIIFVLGLFLPPQTFAENIAESLGIDTETAMAIDTQVKSEVFELVDDILQTVVSARRELNATLGKVDLGSKLQKKEDLTKLAQTLSQPDPQRLQNPELKEQGDAVSPIRTMAQDMNRVHGYGAYRAQEEEPAEEPNVVSSQTDLLKKEDGQSPRG